MSYYPLQYFWVAEYEDGEILPQFDLETGKENNFKLVDRERVEKFHLHPFSEEFAKKVRLAGTRVYSIPSSSFVMDLKDKQRVIWYKDCGVQARRYCKCYECGATWQKKGRPVCPKCGAFNQHKCPDCKIDLSRKHPKEEKDRLCEKCLPLICMDGSRPLNRGDPRFCSSCRKVLLERFCTKCGKVFPFVIDQFGVAVPLEPTYCIGVQENDGDGRNHKAILHIKGQEFWLEVG